MISVLTKGLSFHEHVARLEPIKRDLTRFELRAQQGAEMAQHLHEFCSQVPREKKKTPDFEGMLRKFWVVLMADCQFALDPNVALAAHCDESCMKLNTVLLLSDELRLYGCWLHGTLHKCGTSYTTCKMIYTTDKLEESCIFSKVHLGHSLIYNSESTYNNQRSTDAGAGHSNSKYRESRVEMNALRDTFRVRDWRDDAMAEYIHDTTPGSMVTELKKSNAQIYAELQFHVDKEKKSAPSSPPPTKRKKATTAEPTPPPLPPPPETPAPTKVAAKDKDALKMEMIFEHIERLEKLEAQKMAQRPTPPPPPPPMKTASAKVSERRLDKMRRVAEAKMHVVVTTVIDDLLDATARDHYNEYIRKEHKVHLTELINAHLKNAQRERVLPNLSHMLTTIDNASERVEEITVETQRPSQAVDRHTKIIVSLWKVCFHSPYVNEQLSASLSSPTAERRRERNKSRRATDGVRGGGGGVTHTPSSTDLATLRQLTLAVLYSLKSGFYIAVANSIFMSARGGTAAGQDVCVFAPCDALALLLPPRSKLFYFGEVAQRALRARMARGYFGPAPFDPLEDLAHLDNVQEAQAARSETAALLMRATDRNSAAKIARTSQQHSFSAARALLCNDAGFEADSAAAAAGGAHNVRSVSLVHSSRIGQELRSLQQAEIGRAARKRKRRSGVGQVAIVDGERESNGGQFLSGSGNASSEAAALPIHLREPFLSGSALNHKNLVYSERDIEAGFHFLRKSLESYSVRLHEILNKV